LAQQAAHPSQARQNPFSIDSDSDLPVGLQLNWRVRALIVSGRLAAREPLPSVRRLADWAKVNVNTVRAVYADLEEDGLVVSRQGAGTFVADGVEAAPQLEEIAAEALRRASEAGLSPRELAIVATACASLPGEEEAEASTAPAGSSVELDRLAAQETEAIEVRHELHRQIARLEAELSSYIRDLPSNMPTAHRSAEARLLTVEDLEQTRDTLIAQLSEAQKAAELRAREEGRARARRQMILSPDVAEGESAEGPLAKAMSWWRTRS
jgi:GntR family transcriptional regulator